MLITPKCLQMGSGANGHLRKEYPKCPVPISPKFFQMGSGKNGHLLPQVPIYPKTHLGEMGIRRAPPRAPPSIKCPFAPLPICKKLGNRHRALKVLLSPQVPICHSAHMQTFGEMDTRHLRYSFRKLGVAYPFPSNVHFSQMLICTGAHFPRCPFALNIRFPQEPICLKSLFTSLPICPEGSFAICSVPICPKCLFTPNSSYPQMPVCHSAHHIPKSLFAPSAQFSRTQISGIH